MLERRNGVPSRARVLWANLSAQGARVRERWLTRPLAPCSQLKAHSREREIGSQDCYSNMVKQCLTMFCRETLEYDTFCRETLKYDTFCRKNLDSALWAKKMANLRCEPTPHFMPLWWKQWYSSNQLFYGFSGATVQMFHFADSEYVWMKHSKCFSRFFQHTHISDIFQ